MTTDNNELAEAQAKQEELSNAIWKALTEAGLDSETRTEIYRSALQLKRFSEAVGAHSPRYMVGYYVQDAINCITDWGNFRWAIDRLLKLNEYGYNLEVKDPTFMEKK